LARNSRSASSSLRKALEYTYPRAIRSGWSIRQHQPPAIVSAVVYGSVGSSVRSQDPAKELFQKSLWRTLQQILAIWR
jgi:hypothetical protein